jgi:hypothetical protein
MTLHGRPRLENLFRLIRLRDLCLLNFDNDVVLPYSAAGRRTDWVDGLHGHNRPAIFISPGSWFQTQLTRPIVVEDDRLCLGPFPDRDMRGFEHATSVESQHNIVAGCRTRHLSCQITRVQNLFAIEGANDIAGFELAP